MPPRLSVQFFDHTGDLGVTLAAPTRDALFAAAAAAFTQAVTEPATVQPRRALTIDVRAEDLETLLVDWLSELLYRFEVDQWLTASVEAAVDEEPRGFHLHATAHGETFDSARHAAKVIIKGVTYHALSIGQTPEGWTATVVFDI